VKPPASTYCRAIALSEPQWVESSNFAPRSTTSALQRVTASCSLFAIGSSFDSLEEHPATKSGIRRSGAIRLLRIIFLPLGRRGAPMRATIGQTQLGGGIDQSTTNAPTAIMESTAFATTSAGQGITFTEGEGGGGPG
jgi:hypothetical protein